VLRLWQAALALVAASSLGGAAPPREEGSICVGGPRWQPTLEETRAIEAVPVPTSFDRVFQDPCAERSSNDHNLIGWHMRFGSERSAAAAFAHLDSIYMRVMPQPERYVGALQSAWAQALPDLGRALKVKQPEHSDFSAQWKFVAGSKPIGRLRALLFARESYRFLAFEHIRAAERFHSPVVLGAGERFLSTVASANQFLVPLEASDPSARLLALNLQIFRSDELRMRAAVLRAELTRAPRDMAAAEAILVSLEEPIFRTLAREAYGGGPNFCDISPGAPGDAEKIEAACQDGDMRERAEAFWISRGALDLIADRAAKMAERGDELAARLLERELASDSGRCCYRSAAEDLLRLRLLQGGHYRRALRDVAALRESGDAGEPWMAALNAFRNAEKLAPAVEDPAGFRQAANGWLETWKLGPALFDPRQSSVNYTDRPDDRRYSAYLQRLLDSLDAIVSGAAS